jgi:glycosyltransferase involved in cell wall biosynthesis
MRANLAESVRVLHVTQPVSEGVAQLVLNAARAQVRHGWQVHVACPSPSVLAEELVDQGVVHHRWPAERNPLRGLRHEGVILRRIVQSVEPEVIHLHSSKAGLVGRLVVRGQTPTLFQPHAWSFLHGTWLTRVAAAIWERGAARWASVIICGSLEEYGIAIRRRICAQLVHVPNAIEVSRFDGMGIAGQVARSWLGLRDEPTVVCVGRLSRQKGQDVLLSAWRMVLDAVPTAVLILVGGGPDRSFLEANAPPRTLFLGVRDDCGLWLGAADVVVQPSRWETLSLAVLEAMACGRPVVATDLDSMAQALGTSDPTPLVPIEDPAALSAAVVCRLLNPQLRAVEGIRNRLRAEREFDIASWTDKLLSVSRGVLR